MAGCRGGASWTTSWISRSTWASAVPRAAARRGADPIALMSNVVPVGLLEIGRQDLERTGLYDLFRENDIAPHVANQRVGARKAGAEEAELLEIEPGDPVLTMSRVAYDASGRPIEYGSHVYPAESYWLEIMLVEL